MKRITIIIGIGILILLSGCKSLNQLSNSGDMRCVLHNIKHCGIYNKQVWDGNVVDECKNITLKDFCYYIQDKVTPTQLRLVSRSLHNITFACNYNLDNNWCDYTIEECDTWRIGYWNEYFCEPNEQVVDCVKRIGIPLCENESQKTKQEIGLSSQDMLNLRIDKCHQLGYDGYSFSFGKSKCFKENSPNLIILEDELVFSGVTEKFEVIFIKIEEERP